MSYFICKLYVNYTTYSCYWVIMIIKLNKCIVFIVPYFYWLPQCLAPQEPWRRPTSLCSHCTSRRTAYRTPQCATEPGASKESWASSSKASQRRRRKSTRGSTARPSVWRRKTSPAGIYNSHPSLVLTPFHNRKWYFSWRVNTVKNMLEELMLISP